MRSDRSGQCPYCGSVRLLDGHGRLAAHVPAGLAARSLDGERCPASSPRRTSISAGPPAR